MSSSSTNVGGRWRDSPTARSITRDLERLTRCWYVISVRRRRSYGLKINMINVKHVTNFQQFLVCDFLSRCMRSLVWIHCCKRLNYDFCISVGSVATVLRWSGLNYNRLRYVSSWCVVPKIIQIGECCTTLFYK